MKAWWIQLCSPEMNVTSVAAKEMERLQFLGGKNELSTERRHVDVNVCPETFYLFWLPKLEEFVHEFSMI